MPTVYVLQSESSGKFYIGSAQDLPSRLAEHNRSHSPYTRNRGPGQGFVEHSENGRVILRTTQTERAFEKNGGVLLLQLDVKGLSMNVFQADAPGTPLSGKTALVVTVMHSGWVGWMSKRQSSWAS